MHDILWQGIVSNGFWLIVFLVAVLLFRKQLKDLLSSLAGFRIASAGFEFRDRKSTLEYYGILTNILVEILAQRDSAERFYQFISDASARQLVKFLSKYTKEVPEEDKDIEVLKNVALLVGRKGHYKVAIELYDSLLKHNPDDFDLLYLKARMLRDSRVEENIAATEPIYDNLVKRNPNHSGVWFGRARTKSLLGKFGESMDDLTKAFELKYWKGNPYNMFENDQLDPLRQAKPDDFEKLRAKLTTVT
jgi:tetratricopeptide (TPR) repeat protein